MQRKLKILFVNDHIHFGGGGDAVLRLERGAYEEAGHEVFTFSQSLVRPAEATDHDIICRESRYGWRRKVGKFLGAPQICRCLRSVLARVQPDVIRVHLVSKYPASVYAALHGFRVLQTLHGPNLFCATAWGNLRRDSSPCELGVGVKCWWRGCVSFPAFLLYTLLDQRLRDSVKRVVRLYHCPSRHIQQKAEALGYRPTYYLPCGIAPAFLRAELATHNGPPVILYVGALAEQKGLLFLPDALATVRQKLPDTKLVLCGSGPLEHPLRQEFATRGLSEAVEFKGFVENTRMTSVYQSAHVFVLPSIWSEQFGLVGPEALACGVPCVASNVGGIAEWLRDGQWGYLVPPRNSKALADRLLVLLLNRDMRIRFGQRGRAYALATHHPEVYQRRWLELAEHHAPALADAQQGRIRRDAN